jgi:hypothetical protein
MCQRAVCPSCGGATYRGCGNHVEEVLAGVDRAQRCSCAPAEPAAGSASGGALRRLFGRR